MKNYPLITVQSKNMFNFALVSHMISSFLETTYYIAVGAKDTQYWSYLQL